MKRRMKRARVGFPARAGMVPRLIGHTINLDPPVAVTWETKDSRIFTPGWSLDGSHAHEGMPL